jgi:hypothetical protein
MTTLAQYNLEVQTQQITLGQVYQGGHTLHGLLAIPFNVITTDAIECVIYQSEKSLRGDWKPAYAESLMLNATATREYNGETYYQIGETVVQVSFLKPLTNAMNTDSEMDRLTSDLYKLMRIHA